VKNRIGIIGSYKNIASYNLSTDELVPFITKNVGNLMFRYAVSKDIDEFVPISSRMDAAEVRELVDVLVFPMANNINPSFDMGPMCKFIERCDLPTVVLGLGAQASLGEKGLRSELPEGSKRFVTVIGERCTDVGVRGEFTASVLSDLGLKNIQIVGCPSNFINPSINLGDVISNSFADLDVNGLVRGAIYSQLGGKNLNEPNISSERDLYKYINENNYFYVHTHTKELIEYSRGDKGLKEKWKRNFHKKINPENTFEEFDRVFRSKSMTFSSVESWMEFSRSLDFAIGKRVHGCLNTIQSGVASALIIHDERTKELANTIGLPTLALVDVQETSDLQTLIGKVKFSASEYDKNRKVLFSRYKKIFEDSGMELSNSLTDSW